MHVTLIQRVVPHYRIPLFERLHTELGWNVATAAGRAGFALHTSEGTKDPAWLHRFDFRISNRRQYNARVPLKAIYTALSPDAVLAEFSLQMSSSWKLSLAPSTRRPIFGYWSQGWNVERGFRHPVDLASQLVRMLLLSRADAHLCYSNAGAKFLQKNLIGKSKVFVAPNTLAVGSMLGRNVDLSPPNSAQAQLVWIGRVTKDKRVPMLIQAFALAQARMPQLRLTIVGDGPDMERVRSLSASLPAGSVILRGPVYDEFEIARILQESTLYVSTGSVGLGVNHALAYGVPVMLFDRPAHVRHHPEHCYVVNGCTGFRVVEESVEGFASALTTLLSSGSPKRVMKEGIDSFVAKYATMDTMMEGFREIDSYFRYLRDLRNTDKVI